MSTNTTPEPSAGAVRAAEEIMETLFGPKWQDRKDYIEAAEIIDRETGAGRLAEALESVWCWMESQADAQSKGGHATFDLMMLREQRDIAEDALKTWKENNQTP